MAHDRDLALALISLGSLAGWKFKVDSTSVAWRAPDGVNQAVKEGVHRVLSRFSKPIGDLLMEFEAPATPRAIETRYKGYRFRSRLEARWAVFFDALDLKWDYEPQGFDLDGVRYLPDFWLPELDTWVEVKNENGGDLVKPRLLAAHSNKRVVVFVGSICPPKNASGDEATPGICFLPHGGDDSPYYWCECDVCGAVGIEFEGRAGRLCQCTGDDKNYRANSRRLLAAYAAARSARFEFGESGAAPTRNEEVPF